MNYFTNNNDVTVHAMVVIFGFDDNHNLCSHAGVCVYVCACVCGDGPACKHDISRSILGV